MNSVLTAGVSRTLTPDILLLLQLNYELLSHIWDMSVLQPHIIGSFLFTLQHFLIKSLYKIVVPLGFSNFLLWKWTSLLQFCTSDFQTTKCYWNPFQHYSYMTGLERNYCLCQSNFQLPDFGTALFCAVLSKG